MYCAICGKLKFNIICKTCLDTLSHIESKRELTNGFKVFSTFALSELKLLIASKNNIVGSRILKQLGNYGIKKFFDHHKSLLKINRQDIAIVCVRNKNVGAYSHSAILAKCFKKYGFNVYYNALIIGNDIKYARLNKQQRQEISRNFEFTLNKKNLGVIIVDDIITTGQTLLEASNEIRKCNYTPLFAWTLCDSRF